METYTKVLNNIVHGLHGFGRLCIGYVSAIKLYKNYNIYNLLRNNDLAASSKKIFTVNSKLKLHYDLSLDTVSLFIYLQHN